MDLGQRLDRYFGESMAPLAEHSGTGVQAYRDGVRVGAVGRGGPIFNCAFVTDPPADPIAAIAWADGVLSRTGAPYSVQVPADLEAALAPALEAARLDRVDSMPVMVREPVVAEPTRPPALRIARVEDESSLASLAATMATGFGAPDPSAMAEVLAPGLLTDERVTMLIGLVDDVPVATSICVVHEGVAGVFAVTVVEDARQRGFGAAMTWAAVAAGAREGADLAALQATPMGLPVYTAMGFRTVRTHHRYAVAPADDLRTAHGAD